MRATRSALIALAALLATLAAGCGGDHGSGDHEAEGRIIDVTMTDNAFAPETIRVTKGETVTFRFTNEGSVLHEAFIGDEAEQEEHLVEMAAGSEGSAGSVDAAGDEDGDGHGGDADGHGDDAVVAEPGETVDLTYTFDQEGTLLIGCHEPGHWDDGMKATITVT